MTINIIIYSPTNVIKVFDKIDAEFIRKLEC